MDLDKKHGKRDSEETTAYKRAGAGVTSSLLKSTVSSITPGVSSRVSDDSTFMHSGIKNADEQTDESGDISASRQYDAFGNLVSSNGPWAGPFGYGGPYGYQTDNDHGLMLLGHRYYEPETGRFLTRDPIKDGRNWYGYVGGNPIALADPRGLAPMGPPPFAVPGAPGIGWRWNPDPGNSRQGTWGPIVPIPGGRPQPAASWDPAGHWDLDYYEPDLDRVIRERFTVDGKLIDAGYAHNRNATLYAKGKNTLQLLKRLASKAVKVLVIMELISNGPESAARDFAFQDELEGAVDYVHDQLDRFAEKTRGQVKRFYLSKGGFDPDEW